MNCDGLFKLSAEARAVRKTLNVQQKDVAKTLGIHRVNLTNFESGTHGLDTLPMLRLCKYLGIDPTRFVEGPGHDG